MFLVDAVAVLCTPTTYSLGAEKLGLKCKKLLHPKSSGESEISGGRNRREEGRERGKGRGKRKTDTDRDRGRQSQTERDRDTEIERLRKSKTHTREETQRRERAIEISLVRQYLNYVPFSCILYLRHHFF